MKFRNLLTAGLTAMALFTAGCVGGGDSANKMETPKEGPVELQVSAAASLTDAMKELGGMYEKEHGKYEARLQLRQQRCTPAGD